MDPRIVVCVVVALTAACGLAAGCADDVADAEKEQQNAAQNDGVDANVGGEQDVDHNQSDVDQGPGAPDAPADLTASEGEYTDYVKLTWSQVDRADRYRVYRNGEQLETVDATEFKDTSADPGDVPQAPESLEATDGDHANRVMLSWDEPDVDDGPSYEYTVVAEGQGGDSEESEPAEGWRGGSEITGYEVEIDGESWRDAGEDTTFAHQEAAEPVVEFGEVTATRGDYVEYVRLEVDGVDVEPGEESSYRVRALNEQGEGEASDTAEGYTSIGDYDLQWQRSASDSPDNFSDIPGADTEVYEDYDAPSDASLRYFRIVVVPVDRALKDGLPASDAAPGFRLAEVDWFERDNLAYYVGDTGQASLVDDPVKKGSAALETDGNNERIVSYEGDGLPHYPGPGDDFYVWINSDFSETSFEGPHIYWGPGDGGESSPSFRTRIRQGDVYLRGPGDCEDTNDESLSSDTWYRLEISTTEDGDVDKTVYDENDELQYEMSISCDLSDASGDLNGIGYRAGGFGTTWYDHWTMTQLGGW